MSDTKTCRYCGQIIYSDAQNCEYCGKFLNKEHDNPDLYCKKCKAPVNTDDNFCQNCGAIFNIPEDDGNAGEFIHNIAGIPYHLGILLTSLAASFAITVFMSEADTTIGEKSILFGVAFIVAEIAFYIYFLPSILAIENNNPNAYAIYLCNLLLGVTVIGWFVAFMLAQRPKKDAQ